MNMPRFTAEVSLYRSRHAYTYSAYGGGGKTAPRVVAALSCDEACYAAAGACGIGCGGFDIFCDLGCALGLAICLNQCPSGGGGGGGGGGGTTSRAANSTTTAPAPSAGRRMGNARDRAHLAQMPLSLASQPSQRVKLYILSALLGS